MRSPPTSRILAWIALGATFGNVDLTAQTTTLVPFELEDQFEQVHRHTDYTDRVLVVIGSDRDGSEFNEAWGSALHAALENEDDYARVAFLPVADLQGVPFFIKGMVRGRFPKTPEQWAAMDWDGVFSSEYGFVEGSTNILVFAPNGRLVQRAHGRELDDQVLQSLASPIRVLLSTGG